MTDCVVTLTRSGFAGPVSTAADFRGVTPLVLMRALSEAGTQVHEPCHDFELELPQEALRPGLERLAGLDAEIRESFPQGGQWSVRGSLPARHVHRFQQQLPGLSGGEATWWSRPAGDRPVTGAPPLPHRAHCVPADTAALRTGPERH